MKSCDNPRHHFLIAEDGSISAFIRNNRSMVADKNTGEVKRVATVNGKGYYELDRETETIRTVWTLKRVAHAG